MTPNPVPSIPSREAVEAEARELDELVRLMPQATSDSGSLAARMLRDLRAEVERLRAERDQLRQHIGDLMAVIDAWKKATGLW